MVFRFEANQARPIRAKVMMNKVVTYTDGASRGNPGPAGIGALLLDERGATLAEIFAPIGITTNNEAEYRALIAALDRAAEFTDQTVECYMDSELVARQLNGQYRVKSEKMAELHRKVKTLTEKFVKVTFAHVRREHPQQRLADKLANRGVDSAK
jgi:ribonuclease HI